MITLRRFFAAALGAPILFSALHADDPDRTQDALLVARTWVAEIDAGKYEQSYLDGGMTLHQKVPQDKWIKILTVERPVLGKVINRQETSHSYRPEGFEGENGEFITVSYHTVFENKPDEMEHIVLRREDGRWRGVGYNFGPREVINDPDAGPHTTTTSTTNAPPLSENPTVVPATRKDR